MCSCSGCIHGVLTVNVIFIVAECFIHHSLGYSFVCI